MPGTPVFIFVFVLIPEKIFHPRYFPMQSRIEISFVRKIVSDYRNDLRTPFSATIYSHLGIAKRLPIFLYL